jgi:hypothetical protein
MKAGQRSALGESFDLVVVAQKAQPRFTPDPYLEVWGVFCAPIYTQDGARR